MKFKKVSDIRNDFIRLKNDNVICENGTIEIINASFITDEQTIFGEINENYIAKELDWYLSKERNIKAIKGKVPKIWQDISGRNGEVNSNYGWCIFSEDNKYQYSSAIIALIRYKHSRQSLMIYTRPDMHSDSHRMGMKDFICTNTVQLLIRDNKLNYIVSMRSNDAVFGYKNDKAWHDYVFNMALKDIQRVYPEVEKGYMYWNATSLHVYPRHFHLIKG